MSEFKREFTYLEGLPLMLISRKCHGFYGDRGAAETKYVIPFNLLWKFSEKHNDDYVRFMMNLTTDCYKKLGIGNLLVLPDITKMRIMIDLASCIEDGIQEYLDKPPEPESNLPDERVIGEVEYWQDGQLLGYHEFTSRMFEEDGWEV